MTKINDKMTKAQIIEKYNELSKQLENLAAGKHDPAAVLKAKQEGEVLNNAKLTVQQSVESQIAELQKSMVGILGNLSGNLAEKIQEYNNLEEAIELKKAELKEIHEIEVKAFALAALINTQTEISEKFDAEAAQKREELTEALNQLRADINEERTKFRQEIAEEKAKLELERQRDEEVYEYDFNRRKQQREDSLNDSLQAARKKHNEELVAKEKAINELEDAVSLREEEVSQREAKMAELEAKVAALPEKEAEIRKEAEAAAKSHYDKVFGIKESALKKEYESKETVYESKIQMLQDQLTSEQAKTAELSEKLDKAYGKIQDVAIATANRPSVEYRSSGDNK
ncbi:gp268 [Bacillus phage G]|uniref:Gp268 n=1 Tax=Bacillus phage G TaxID=2884420 RepID=G3MA09_9CAUD|nr:gp268 [Bacillus phage G]AEO93527.1 gp268 [Bacillus phage G]